MDKDTRYNMSEKGRQRNYRYRTSLKGREAEARCVYARMRSRLVTRIANKQLKVVELERILEDV